MKFSIVANTKQENIREILKKVIGFVDDFELDVASAQFLGLSGVEIKDLSGDVIISLGGDGTIFIFYHKLTNRFWELILEV